MRVFVSGASGFLASNLIRFLSSMEIAVWGSTSRPANEGLGCQKLFSYKLGESADQIDFTGIDVVIHCAHDFSPGHIDQNIEGTKNLFFKAQNQGVRRQIFISSYSAQPDATSEYGIIKFKLENFFLQQDQTVVKPGLIVGNGGLFSRIKKNVIRFPLLPLVDGGNGVVPLVGIQDLCRSVFKLIELDTSGQFYLFLQPLTRQCDMVRTIAKTEGKVVSVVNIPYKIAYGLLKLISFLPLGISLESLKSYHLTQNVTAHSSLGELLGHCMSLEEIIHAAR